MPTPPPADTSSTLDLAAAVERRANIAGTLYERFTNPKPDAAAVPGFDPSVSIPKGYESVAPIFNNATSPQDMEWRRQQYDREQADNRVIQSHGGYGFAASMAAGLTDPVTLASMAIPVGGATRLAQAGRLALAAGATTAAQEAAMQALEVSRTGKESALNIAAGTVLGGVLGAAIRPHVPTREFNAMADAAHAELHGEGGEQVLGPIDGRQRIIPETDQPYVKPHPESGKIEEPTQAAAGGPSATPSATEPKKEGVAPTTAEPALTEPPLSISEMHVNPEAESTAGAAAAVTPTMRGETIARGAETLSNTLGRVSPGGRLLNSPSIESRKLLQELANVPETMAKNYEGAATAQPIERELWKYDGIHWQGMQARGEAYRTYRERVAGEGGEPMVRGEFNQEIAKAMRRGDQHQVPEVAKAAQDTRRIEFEPLKARAQKLGLLPEEVKATGADSYLMRQYDAQKIRGNMSDWLTKLREGFVSQGVDRAEAADIAHQATRNVLGSERGTMDWHVLDGIVPESGRFKERTLQLPDTLLEPYLNSDIDHIAHSYQRSMAPEVEMTERFGSRDMKDQIADVKDDYARMIERAKDDGEKQGLYAQMEKDLRDLTAVRDRLYGIYGQPKDPGAFSVRAGRLLRSVNALRLLGAATLAHFPDMANVMMRYGMPQTFAAIGKVLTSPEAIRLTSSQAKRMGAGLDMTMNATASMLGDYATHSQYPEQRVANYLTRMFTITTGETPLITAVQQLTSTMAQDQLIRTAQKVGRGAAVDKNLMARMAGAGIDQDMLSRIAEQHDEFGATVNGLHFGMSDQWTDKAAASAFESAVLRDAHSVTLRPGVGDTPLFMSTEWGKSLRQFTTFGYAAQRSVVNPLMQGLAHGDPRAAQAMFALASMGTLSYVAKQTAAGQPIEPFNSPKFAMEVLDKSNLMGWTSDYVFPALWMMGAKSMSRWSDRDPVETIGGPSVGTVFSTYGQQLPAKFLGSDEPDATFSNQGGVKRADVHFIRRLMPGQNLWYARNTINQLEDAIGDAFDLQGKSNADRVAENVQ
jgi:hypothetical protein